VRVRWLRAALADIDAEVDYIARDNPAAADRVADKVNRSVGQLTEYPSTGRAGRVPGTRELVISGTSYIVVYRVRDRALEILRVFHAARRWPPEF
jgi:toxin ParE1/3/4